MTVKIPSLIYIGPHDYDVKVKKRLDLLGETDSINTLITVKKQQSLTTMQDTLVHESLHAIIFQSGAFKTLELDHDNEEKLVVTLSPWLLQWLKDNPALVAYLTEAAA